jgi:hypothetical protein
MEERIVRDAAASPPVWYILPPARSPPQLPMPSLPANPKPPAKHSMDGNYDLKRARNPDAWLKQVQ